MYSYERGRWYGRGLIRVFGGAPYAFEQRWALDEANIGQLPRNEPFPTNRSLVIKQVIKLQGHQQWMYVIRPSDDHWSVLGTVTMLYYLHQLPHCSLPLHLHTETPHQTQPKIKFLRENPVCVFDNVGCLIAVQTHIKDIRKWMSMCHCCWLKAISNLASSSNYLYQAQLMDRGFLS